MINREGFYDDGVVRQCTSCRALFTRSNNTVTLCPQCNSKRVKESTTPEWKMYQRAKCRAKEREIEFNLDLSDIEIPDECPILGIPLKIHSGRSGAYKDSPSLDRIDNTKGYIKGNVQVISQLANAMKSNATKEDLLMFAQWVMEKYSEN